MVARRGLTDNTTGSISTLFFFEEMQQIALFIKALCSFTASFILSGVNYYSFSFIEGEPLGFPFLISFVFVQFKLNFAQSRFNLTCIGRHDKIFKYSEPLADVDILCQMQDKSYQEVVKN